MKRWIFLLTVLACGATLSARAQDAKPAADSKDAKAPAAAQEGTGYSLAPLMVARNTCSCYITGVEKTSAPQKFYDRNLLVRNARFDPTEDMSKTPAIARDPAAGNAYILITVQLWDRKKKSQENTSVSSVGKYDYLLRTGGKDYACLAIAAEGDTFDERLPEIRFKAGSASSVILIFELPADAAKAELVPRFPQMFQEDAEAKPQEIPLGMDTNTKKKPAAAKPAAAATAAKGGCDSPEDVIATGCRLLEAKDYPGFFRSCMPPAMVAEMEKNSGGKFDMAASMTGSMLAPALVPVMNGLKGKKPQYNADKTRAAFDDEAKTVMMKIDGRWYIDAK